MSTADWDNPFWTNKQHVAVELARSGHRIFYIDSLGLRRPSVSGRDLRRIARRLLKAVHPPHKVRDNLWVWSPIVLPWHGHALIRGINRVVLGAGLWCWCKILGIKQELLWTYNPLTTEFIEVTSYPCRVYHCVDEIKAQPGMPVYALEQAEKLLANQVNIIFTTSPGLSETRREWNANTYYLPNVADYKHFSAALDAQTLIPGDLVEITGPRIGFIGAISGYKIDFSLIRYIAEVHPDWSIVLIGEIGEGDPWTDSAQLHGLPNLFLLGPRAYKDLPAYMKGFDVGLLPNIINEYTDAMFPMKFFEYLAAGIPVVSVDLKAIRAYSDVVTIADSPERFIVAIEEVLAGISAPLGQRLEVASAHTYEARTRCMLTLIDEVCGS